MNKKLDRITIDGIVCMGQAIIRGMRITVTFILKLLGSGMTYEEVLAACSELKKEYILQAISGESVKPLVSIK